MTMNPLPPQAYTKETLLKAYAWLMNQSASIREMATTPDILVSLYLKATRDGDGALDRPSIQNFKNELKNLAGLMGELDRPQGSSPQAPPPPPPASTMQTQTNVIVNMPSAGSMPTFTVQGEAKLQIDPTSLAMIQEVKEELNLSSEAEALRMLVKIGYTRSKNLLK